MLTEVHMFLFR